jgi:hypothetical protein
MATMLLLANKMRLAKNFLLATKHQLHKMEFDQHPMEKRNRLEP